MRCFQCQHENQDLDLAALAHEQGNRVVAAVHLNQAYAGFTPLPVPKYIERTERLARDYSVTLTVAEMEPTESVEELT